MVLDDTGTRLRPPYAAANAEFGPTVNDAGRAFFARSFQACAARAAAAPGS
jgi:hypothetical protein